MPSILHSLFAGLIAALLLLQPAIRAGAGCAEALLSASCACSRPIEDDSKAASCCTTREHADPTPVEGARIESAGGHCACELAPVPDATATPAGTGGALDSDGARGWIDACAAAPLCEAQAGRAQLGVPWPPGPPPDHARADHDFVGRHGAARFLTFVCTSRR